MVTMRMRSWRPAMPSIFKAKIQCRQQLHRDTFRLRCRLLVIHRGLLSVRSGPRTDCAKIGNGPKKASRTAFGSCWKQIVPNPPLLRYKKTKNRASPILPKCPSYLLGARWPDFNRHRACAPRDFKSLVSANSTTSANRSSNRKGVKDAKSNPGIGLSSALRKIKCRAYYIQGFRQWKYLCALCVFAVE